MKLGKQVGLVPGHIVLDGDPARPKRGTAPPPFSAHVHCGQTVAHLSYWWAFANTVTDLVNIKREGNKLQGAMFPS